MVVKQRTLYEHYGLDKIDISDDAIVVLPRSLGADTRQEVKHSLRPQQTGIYSVVKITPTLYEVAHVLSKGEKPVIRRLNKTELEEIENRKRVSVKWVREQLEQCAERLGKRELESIEAMLAVMGDDTDKRRKLGPLVARLIVDRDQLTTMLNL